MNVALRKPMTVAKFLTWDERQEQRYEFDGFQPLAMAGGTAAHSAIQTNLIIVGVDGPAASCAKVWLSLSEPEGPST